MICLTFKILKHMSESYLNWCAMSGEEQKEYGRTHGFCTSKPKESEE